MPDAQRLSYLRQNFSAVMQAAGQTAVWRDYVSASAQQAEFGLATALYFQMKPITGLFEAVRAQEIMAAGGTYQAGDIRITMVEPISIRDEVVWENNRYMLVGEPAAVSLWGVPAYMTIIRRA